MLIAGMPERRCPNVRKTHKRSRALTAVLLDIRLANDSAEVVILFSKMSGKL
jgi:hypothetical protein